MFFRLVQKELYHHLLDFRFIAIFVLCALLSVLSVTVGIETYFQQLQEYSAVSEDNRRTQQEILEKNSIWDLIRQGVLWNRRPEALSPVVYGLSGHLGREVFIKHLRPAFCEDSLFSVDPIHSLFGILDFAFIVKIILSLCVLLLTYDSVCGEKEAGTLRLYASFPVPRSSLALAKLVGSTLAALVPLLFSTLLISAVVALSPGLGLQAGDWARLSASLGIFALYLAVFAAFGLWVSALTHRRMAAFLGLLGLWTVWTFILPNLALRAAQSLAPVESVHAQKKESNALRWDTIKGNKAERQEYWRRHSPGNWNSLSETRQRELLEGARGIQEKWDTELYARLSRLQDARQNQVRKQQRLVMALSAFSPMSAVSITSMDLARTGFVQQERLERSLNAYLVTVARFIREKRTERFQGRTLTDFSWFTYRDSETLGECLARNAFHILNLALLAVAGFAGAYVAILRYDVR